jgi:ATP-dependent Lhr-like helicase
VFDLPALVDLLRRMKERRIRVRTVDSRTPSPFAASLLFSYVANFIYDGDAPLAERRAQALSVDPAQLRELLGEAELRDLLDPDAVADTEKGLQRLDGRRPAHSVDSLHDMLLSLGDLSRDEIGARSDPPGSPGAEASGAEAPGAEAPGAEAPGADAWVDELLRSGRAVEARVGGDLRVFAAEDAARYRDALGVEPPRNLPKALLTPVADPLGDLVSRYARTHGPFLAADAARRLGLGIGPVRDALARLGAAGRVLEGEFLPRSMLARPGAGAPSREFCDAEVLRTIKRRSLARLRREVEPAPQAALARFLLDWQGVRRPRTGPDALLAAVEQLEATPLAASTLESEVLPVRAPRFRPGDLDMLCAAGEVVWAGVEPVGPSDGRIALYLADHLRLLAPPPRPAEGELAGKLRALLAARGALFFSDLTAATGAFSQDVLAALWDLVWAGEATNDTLAPLRGLLRGTEKDAPSKRALRSGAFRPRRAGPPGSEGRWSLLPHVRDRVMAGQVSGTADTPAAPRLAGPSETERRAALAKVLLERHGVVTREAVHAEGIEGGFSAVYDVFKAMEEAGRVRRGYFVAGLGATQFAAPGAEDRLRSMRDRPEAAHLVVLAATDPASPYGAALPWPERTGARPGRTAGAFVILRDGELIGYLGRAERTLLSFLPESEPEHGHAAEALAKALAGMVEQGRRRTLLITHVDGEPTEKTALAPRLAKAGFTATSRGFFKRGMPPRGLAQRG